MVILESVVSGAVLHLIDMKHSLRTSSDFLTIMKSPIIGSFLHYSRRWPVPGSQGDSLPPSAERPPHPDQSPVQKKEITHEGVY